MSTRFYIKPAIRPDVYDCSDVDWARYAPRDWKEFKQSVKDAFRPVNGEATMNLHVNRNSIPAYVPYPIQIGFVKVDGIRYDLSIERAPQASRLVFNHTEFYLVVKKVS